MNEERKSREKKREGKNQTPPKRKRKESDGKSSPPGLPARPSPPPWISFVLFHCLKKRKRTGPQLSHALRMDLFLSTLLTARWVGQRRAHCPFFPVSVCGQRRGKKNTELVPGDPFSLVCLATWKTTSQERDLCVFRLVWPSRFLEASLSTRASHFFLFCNIAKPPKKQPTKQIKNSPFSSFFANTPSPCQLPFLSPLPKPTNTSWVDAAAPHEENRAFLSLSCVSLLPNFAIALIFFSFCFYPHCPFMFFLCCTADFHICCAQIIFSLSTCRGAVCFWKEKLSSRDKTDLPTKPCQ
jgi:hypothetical protein